MTIPDPALIEAARKQLLIIISNNDAMALLGWREAWKPEIGDDVISDLLKEAMES